MAWGRAVVGGAGAGAGAGGGGGEGIKGRVNGEASASKESRRINVLATGSVDLTIKVGPCFLFSNSYVSSTQGTPDRSGHPSRTLKLLLLYLYIKKRIYRHYTSSRRDFTTISIMRYAPSINMLI